MRFPLAIAAVGVVSLGAATAEAQLGSTTGAAAGFLSQIRSSAVGTGYSVNSINSGTLQNSRAQAANNGITTTQVTSSSIPTTTGIGTTVASSKPFSGVTQGPTISPYLQLFNTNLDDTVDNYNAFVRPQLEQQRFNRGVQRQQQQLNSRVQALSARPAFQSQGSERIMPTGHTATFGYYSHFYPTKGRRR